MKLVQKVKLLVGVAVLATVLIVLSVVSNDREDEDVATTQTEEEATPTDIATQLDAESSPTDATPLDSTPSDATETDSQVLHVEDDCTEVTTTEAVTEATTEYIPVVEEPTTQAPTYTEPQGGDSVLTMAKGVNYNAQGRSETWYNLDMTHIVQIMRDMGFDEENYPYWIREDGVKMLGPYVMVAANFSINPRGTIVETSLGTGLVCDTGGFVEWNPTGLDIATNW